MSLNNILILGGLLAAVHAGSLNAQWQTHIYRGNTRGGIAGNDSIVYIASYDELFTYDTMEKTLKVIGRGENAGGTGMLYLTHKGTLWTVGPEFIYIYNGFGFQKIPKPPFLNQLYMNSENKMLAATLLGLLEWNDGNWIEKNDIAWGVYEDSTGALWGITKNSSGDSMNALIRESASGRDTIFTGHEQTHGVVNNFAITAGGEIYVVTGNTDYSGPVQLRLFRKRGDAWIEIHFPALPEAWAWTGHLFIGLESGEKGDLLVYGENRYEEGASALEALFHLRPEGDSLQLLEPPEGIESLSSPVSVTPSGDLWATDGSCRALVRISLPDEQRDSISMITYSPFANITGVTGVVGSGRIAVDKSHRACIIGGHKFFQRTHSSWQVWEKTLSLRIRDNQGNLWFHGTGGVPDSFGGTVMFNGSTFKAFGPDNSPLEKRSYHITPGFDESVWFFSDSTLSEYSNDSLRSISIPSQISGKYMFKELLEDQAGNVWLRPVLRSRSRQTFLHDGNIVMYDQSDWKAIDVGFTEIEGIVLDSAGSAHVYGVPGVRSRRTELMHVLEVSRYDSSSGLFQNSEAPLFGVWDGTPPYNVPYLWRDMDGRIWVVANHGMYLLAGRHDMYRLKYGPPIHAYVDSSSDYFGDVIQDSSGTIYRGSRDGKIAVFRDNSWEIGRPYAGSIPLLPLLAQENGTAWFFTNDGFLLFRNDQEPIMIDRNRAGMSKHSMYSDYQALEDHNETVWIQTGGAVSSYTTEGTRIMSGSLSRARTGTRSPVLAIPTEKGVEFRVSLPERGTYTLQLFDVSGRTIKRFSGQATGAEDIRVLWDGSTEGGIETPRGMYVVRLLHRGKTYSRAFTKIK